MAALLGGGTGAAGAGGLASAGAATDASATAASTTPWASYAAAPSAGTSYGVMQSDVAQPYTIPGATNPPNYVMQSSGGQPYQLPGPMWDTAPTAQSWMAKLMEYAKRNPPTAPDRSMPSAPSAQAPPPPQGSHMLGQSGQYPTLASLMAVQLPTMQPRG